MKTYVPKRAELQHDWWIVDAEGLTLGRLATEIARRIRGKHKPTFTPFLDVGDHVIVVNADKVVLSGNKLAVKLYRRHSGYPGGLNETTAAEMLEKHPERVIESAVRGMLPKGPLGRKLFRKLKVYAAPREPGQPLHPHEAQKPQPLVVAHAARGI